MPMVVTQAPPWVWLILAYLVVIGVRRLRPRIIRPVRLALMPTLFIVWGLTAVASQDLSVAAKAGCWVGGALAGVGVGAVIAPVGAMRRDRRRGHILLPGSAATLVVGVGEFIVKFALAAATAMRPDLHVILACCEIAVSGAGAGYFTGWAGRIALAYPRLPEATLAAA